MSINGVGNNNYNYGNYTQNNVNKTQGTNEVENTSMTSDEFLKELKQEFPEMNIYTANVTDNNKGNFAGGTGIYNVAVSKKYMDEVASDPQKRAEFKEKVRGMKEAKENRLERSKRDGTTLVGTGFTIDDKGQMASWSHTTRTVEKPSKGFGVQSLFSSLNSSREERKIKEQERAEKRLEKRKLERKEQREEDEKRLEERREEKRMEEKRRLESLNNEDVLNSSVNKVVVDTYQKDINFENNLPDFNTEI